MAQPAMVEDTLACVPPGGGLRRKLRRTRASLANFIQPLHAAGSGISSCSGSLATALKGPLLGAMLVLFSAAAWPAATASEYRLKAVFLFNFTQFVEWPADAFANADSPLVICVLGQDPFGTELDDIVRGEKVNQRSLAVRRFGRVEDIDSCHVLFVSRSENARLPQILQALKGTRTLTVGEVDEFNRHGGMIVLATVANKIRLRINLDAARAANLTISSNLLRPAEIVAGG